MARTRLNLKNLSITDKLAKGRQIITAMTNNASFPTPNPPLTEITAALDELTQAFALVRAAKSEIATRVVTQDNAEARAGLDQTRRLCGKRCRNRRLADHQRGYGNQSLTFGAHNPRRAASTKRERRRTRRRDQLGLESCRQRPELHNRSEPGSRRSRQLDARWNSNLRQQAHRELKQW